MNRRQHRRRYSQIDDGAWQRDVQVFLLSVIIGACLGGFVVYLAVSRPDGREVQALQGQLAEVSQRGSGCEKDKATLIELREEALHRLSQCNALLAQRSSTSPLPIPTEVVVPASKPSPPEAPDEAPLAAVAEEFPVAKGVPLPKRPPSRPAGDVPAVEVLGASRLSSAFSVTLKVGEERTLAPGYSLRLVAVSQRKTGDFCVLAGSGLGSGGARIASGSSNKSTWNGQRLTVGAIMQDKQSCRVSVKP